MVAKGFPENSLTTGETVERHLRPHWRASIVPFAILVVYIVATVWAWILMGGNSWGQVFAWFETIACFGIVVGFAIWPILVRRTTHIVITNERIILRTGVLRHKKREIQLKGLDEVGVDQTLIDRAFGCGDLVLDKDGGRRLENLPDVEAVEVLVNDLIKGRGHQKGVGDTVLEGIVSQRDTSPDS